MSFLFFWFRLNVPVLAKKVYFFPLLFFFLLPFLTQFLTIALELLYHSTDGPNWRYNDDWVPFFLSSFLFSVQPVNALLFIGCFIFIFLVDFFSSKMSGTVCDAPWFGVKCDMSGNISRLSLVYSLFFLLSLRSLNPKSSSQKTYIPPTPHSTNKLLFFSFRPHLLIYFYFILALE